MPHMVFGQRVNSFLNNFHSLGSYALICRTWCLDRESIAFSITFIPPGTLIFAVEKFVWAPAPFQSPAIGLGSKDTHTPKSSATLSRRYLATHISSATSIPSVGPTWNSH